jgi:Uma2 family endonuclease
MTIHVAQDTDGLSRRPFTVAELERMIESGVIGADENLELIEGDIVPMAAKYHAHERVKSALILALAPVLPQHLWLGVESSIRLSDQTLVEPDLAIYRRDLNLADVRGPDILLAVEVADTTLAFDKGPKATLYAAYGVNELWVVDASRRVTFVHREPSSAGWGSVREVGPDEPLQASGLALAPIRLAEID